MSKFNFLFEKSYNYFKKAEYKKALGLINKAKINLDPEVTKDLLKYYSLKGNIHAEFQNYKAALYNFEIQLKYSKKFNNKEAEAIAYGSIGFCHRVLGYYEEAKIVYIKQLNIAKKMNKQSILILSYNNLAVINFLLKDYIHAIQFCEKAINLTFQFKKNYELTFLYSTLGHIYKTINEGESASKYFKLQLQLSKKLKNKRQTASALGDIGSIYLQKNNTEKAVRLFNEQNEICIKNNYRLGIVESYLNLGDGFKKLNQNERSLKNYFNAYNLNRKIFGLKHARTSLPLSKIAEIYFKRNDFDKAIKYINSAIRCLYISDRKSEKKFVISEAMLAEKLIIKAGILRKKGILYNDQKTCLGSLKLYREIILLSEKVRLGFKEEDSKIFHNENLAEIFEEAIGLCYHLYKKNRHFAYLNYFYFFLQKSKTSILIEQIRDYSEKVKSNIPKRIIEKERSLQHNIRILEKRIFENEKKYPETLKDQLFELKQRLAFLKEEVEKKYPDLLISKLSSESSSISGIKSVLKPDEAFIEFFWGTEKCFQLTVTPGKVSFTGISINEKLRQNILYVKKFSCDYNYMSIEKNSGNYLSASNYLYKLFLKKHLNDRIKKLIIIPDSILYDIPFEILTSSSRKSIHDLNYNDYIISGYEFIYDYSSILFVDKRKVQKKFNNDIYGIAPDFSSDAAKMLFNNAKEVELVKELPGGRILTGKKATKSNFLKSCRGIFLFHLATHFETGKNLLYSKILFNAPGKTGSNVLYTYELFNKNLNSNIAIISVCNAGEGNIVKGEGIYNLVRAFVYSGCENIIFNMIHVSDKSSLEIFKNFYQNLKSNISLADSLRLAKLKFLQESDPLKSIPYYWANYVLVGSGE